uniref:Nitric oxide synthase-interacting protein homolog n=1 Tax=Trichuris muris TaxID=70415 RepID=A0A5S6QUF2_TRIMR
MTRHQKNATASTVYTYYERRKDQRASGYGTLEERLSKTAFKDFDCCSLTLQRCREPVVTPDGYLFDYEAILKYILHHKKENARKRKLYEDYLSAKEREREDEKEAQLERKVRRFETAEATPARRNIAVEDSNVPTSSSSAIFKANDSANTDVKNFWVPSLSGSVVEATAPQPPEDKVFCPITGKPLRLKDLLHIKFKVANSVSQSELASGKNVYVCALTGDILTNATPCVVLKTSGYVITVESLEKVVKKEWIDPFNGKKLTEDDLVFLKRGGTGFAATNENLKSKLIRPALELQ